jgi:hypothetical protein
MADKQGRGRKPLEASEKMILVGFYTKQYIVDKLGGKDFVRGMAKAYVERNYQKKK